jgi:ribosome-binding protein aMBF1 (putative translation factor)
VPAGRRRPCIVQAVYYRDRDGVEPVNDFIDGLAPERQEEIDYKIGLLNRMGSNDPPLPFPQSSPDGQLRELRCHSGRDPYRILLTEVGQPIHPHRQGEVRGLPAALPLMARPTTRSSRTTSSPEPARRATSKLRRDQTASPVGSTADQASARRAARSPEYRAQRAEREASGRDKGLSQQQLADLVGTSHSQISGIESGRHRTNLDTLTLIGHALDRRIVLGFESATPSGRAKRELVAF